MLSFIAADGNVRSKSVGHDKDALTIGLMRADRQYFEKFFNCLDCNGTIKDTFDRK